MRAQTAAASLLLLLCLLLDAALAVAAAAQHASRSSKQRQHPHPQPHINRRLLIRPMPGTAIGLTCRNTLLGPFDYADDRGLLCKVDDLDFKTGCCRKGDKHACGGCGKDDHCCGGYEACVSCCLAPEHNAAARVADTPRVPGRKASGTWADAWELCAAVCRTHGRSTAHENAYIDGARHHCFSKLGKPLLSPPLAPGALDGVTVTMGAAGLSCDAVCERTEGRRCSARHLPLLDTCDRLREASACEAGCVREAAGGGAAAAAGVAPMYAADDAPKADRPALCIASTSGGGGADAAAAGGAAGAGAAAAPAQHSCSASQKHMRRLCPCVEGGGENGKAQQQQQQQQPDAAAAAHAPSPSPAPAAAAAAKQQQGDPDALAGTTQEGPDAEADDEEEEEDAEDQDAEDGDDEEGGADAGERRARQRRAALEARSRAAFST